MFEDDWKAVRYWREVIKCLQANFKVISICISNLVPPGQNCVVCDTELLIKGGQIKLPDELIPQNAYNAFLCFISLAQ